MRVRLTIAVALAALTATLPLRLGAQSGATQAAPAGQVIGSRSFSPMVENVDAAAQFYERLGLKVTPPAGGGATYPWDEEAWHYDLHGGQAPRSQMRFMYASVPGAVAPAMPLLVEPVEHRNIDRRSQVLRPQDPGVTTLVLLVRDLDAAAKRLPDGARQPVRTVRAYGGMARAMTVAVPGAHLVELLQLDPLPATTAPADASVIGAWVRVTVADLDRTLSLYRDAFGLSFQTSTLTDADVGGLAGTTTARVKRAAATLPGPGTTLEFLEFSGVDRRAFTPRIQDPGAVRLQLTVRRLETTLDSLHHAGPSIVASNGIVTQPQYRVAVASDLNGLFLVLTDRPASPPGSARP